MWQRQRTDSNIDTLYHNGDIWQWIGRATTFRKRFTVAILSVASTLTVVAEVDAWSSAVDGGVMTKVNISFAWKAFMMMWRECLCCCVYSFCLARPFRQAGFNITHLLSSRTDWFVSTLQPIETTLKALQEVQYMKYNSIKSSFKWNCQDIYSKT